MNTEDHWLWRLSATQWFAAANVELERGRDRVDSRRAAVTHARRAAGMALNGALVAMSERGWSREQCETAWGRSYVDHLRALALTLETEDTELRGPFDAAVCERCRELLGISVMPAAGLVRLARTRDEAARAALELAAELVRCSAASSPPRA